MKVFFVALFATAAAFTMPQSSPVRSVRPLQATSNTQNTAFVAGAGALPAILAASPANAALPSVGGVPGGVVLTFFPLIIAATVALLVIGPGAIQQFQRVFTGQSSKYMKGDY